MAIVKSLKTEPKTESCDGGEHHFNGLFVSLKEVDLMGYKGRKGSVMQYTCQACGERWFTRIKDK